jgi:hypothetical protein
MNIGIRSFLAAAVLLPAMAVNAAKVGGIVTDRASGDPVSGARVIIASLNGNATRDTATTDGKGAYSFDNVATGFKTLVASKDGYQPNTVNVNVLQNNGSYTANVSLVPTNGGSQTGAIAGTVKDDASKEAIKGATVVLSHPAGRGGATPIDTVVTDGEGRFFFPVVPAATGYIVVASLAGYADGSNSNVTVTNKDTANKTLTLKKLPTPNASILGKVRDAATKTALPNSQVILRRRGTNGAWQNLDTLVSDAQGLFVFSHLEPSTLNQPYSLLASVDNYVTGASANIVVANNTTDTVDVLLTKVARGSMTLFVGRDTTGNPALEGAQLVAILDGDKETYYTGATDAKGWVTFPSVVAGAYSVSANLSGFVSKVVARTVTPNEKDTGYVYLARATAQNSKSLSGIVRDADGKAVAGAKVLFEGNGNGITLSATTTSTGDYAFSGIPTNVAGGAVTVTKDGYLEFSGNVTLGAQASFLNVTLKLAASGIVRAAMQPQRLGLVREGRDLAAVFTPAQVSGSLSLFDARGSRLGVWTVPAGAARASLGSVGSSRAAYLVLRQGALVQNLALPH